MDILAESSVRSALIAAGVVLVLKLARVASPQVRHTAWTGVTLVMLLSPVLAGWGPHAPIPLLPAETTEAGASVGPLPGSSTPARPDASVRSSPSANANMEAAARPGWRAWVAAVYLLGVAALLFRLAMGVLQVRRLIRSTVVIEGRLTHDSCATPMTVGWIRPTVILPRGWPQWPAGQLDAILAHEGEHVRRRDPLVQCLALVNRAVFWFHPLAWWLERHLSALAEEASDAAVLARGHDPHDYAGYLLDVARSMTRSGGRAPAISMAMPGTNLPHRIRQILDGVSPPPASRVRLACAGALSIVSTTAFAVGTPAQVDVEIPAFEVVSIRSNPAGEGQDIVGLQRGGRVIAPNVTAEDVVRTAYGLFEDEQLIGGPDWLGEDRFSIEARASATASVEQVRLMLRRLLAERFALVGHSETRQLELYELTRGRRDARVGAGLRPAGADCAPIKSFFDGPAPPAPPPPPPENSAMIPVIPPRRSEWQCPGGFSPGWLSGRQMTMSQLAQALTQLTRRHVVDRTGLDGRFDVDFTYAPDGGGGLHIVEGAGGVVGGPAAGAETPAAPTEGRSIFTAIRDDLGLALQSSRGPVSVFVIERVERPSAN